MYKMIEYFLCFSLKDHLDLLNSVLLDLRNIDNKVEDEDVALLLLVSLPQSYENFVGLFIVNKDTVILEQVGSALHSRELRHQASDTVTDEASGLITSDNNGLELGNNNRNKKLCSKGSKPDDETKQSGSIVIPEDDTKSEQDIALVADGNTHPSDVWVLDTRASYHMCLRREWFATYTLADNDIIKRTNSSISKVVGVGSIKIRTHLNDVIHVPSIEKTLISVSLLDNRGFKFSGGDGILKVCKGSYVILNLKGIMRGTLYILHESTVTCSHLLHLKRFTRMI